MPRKPVATRPSAARPAPTACRLRRPVSDGDDLNRSAVAQPVWSQIARTPIAPRSRRRPDRRARGTRRLQSCSPIRSAASAVSLALQEKKHSQGRSESHLASHGRSDGGVRVQPVPELQGGHQETIGATPAHERFDPAPHAWELTGGGPRDRHTTRTRPTARSSPRRPSPHDRIAPHPPTQRRERRLGRRRSSS